MQDKLYPSHKSSIVGMKEKKAVIDEGKLEYIIQRIEHFDLLAQDEEKESWEQNVDEFPETTFNDSREGDFDWIS